MEHHIVLVDPTQRYNAGTVIASVDVAALLGNGGVALPYQKPATDVGNSGWIKREFGVGVSGALELPFSMFVPRGESELICAAFVKPQSALLGSMILQHRLHHGTARVQFNTGSPIALQAVPMDPRGIAVHMSAKVLAETDGTVSFSVSGTIAGGRVCWVGATLVRKQETDR